MAIGVINVPMCHSILIRLVSLRVCVCVWWLGVGGQGRGDGLCLINIGEIPSANKDHVRFLIRRTCLKAALALED